MAATFGMKALENVAKSLCDVTAGMIGNDVGDVAPVAVHVQAIRLAAPSKAELGEAEAGHVLGELTKVRMHYGFASLAQEAPADAVPAAQ
jgi:hypothetical protein